MLLLRLLLTLCFAFARASNPLENESLSVRENPELSNYLEGFMQDLKGWVGGTDFKSTLACDTCRSFLKYLQKYATDDKKFIAAGHNLCSVASRIFDTQHPDVCMESVVEHGPILANTLRNIGTVGKSDSADLMCNIWMKACPAVNLTWNVPLPLPKPARSRPKPSKKDPIQIVHFSDIHLDPKYVEGADAECGNPLLCCRNYTKKEAPGENFSPAGKYGHIKRCDTPYALEKSMYQAIQKLVPNAAFSIFTGDIIERQIWKSSVTGNTKQIVNAYTNMSSYFNLVYPTVGNHEATPINAFEPNAAPGNHSQQWLYDTLSKEWFYVTGMKETNDITAGGHYSVKVPDRNLRIISLNTNFYYFANLRLYEEPLEKDPNGQLKWLVQKLDAAEKAGENVYIIGHMPMGDMDALPHTSNYFNQIIDRYSSTIAAMFFGHTHLDQIQISYSDYSNQNSSNAIITSYIAPSLTPSNGFPAFRVYDVDPDTFGVLDMTTYMTNMSHPSFQFGPVWEKYYSAKEAYGLKTKPRVKDPTAELTASFWHNVTKKFETSSKLFNKYYERKVRGWEAQKPDKDRRNKEICLIRGGRSEDNCAGVSIGSKLRKRDLTGKKGEIHNEQVNHCGTPVAMEMFGGLTDPDVRERLLEEIDAELEHLKHETSATR